MEYVANGHGSPITDITVEKRVRTVSGDIYEAWSPDGNKILGILVTILLPGQWSGVLSSTSGRFANKIAGNNIETIQKWGRMDSLRDGETADRVRQYRIGVETSQGTVYYYTEAMREMDFRRLWGAYSPAYGETADWGGFSTKSFYQIGFENGFAIRRNRRFNTEVYDATEWTN